MIRKVLCFATNFMSSPFWLLAVTAIGLSMFVALGVISTARFNESHPDYETKSTDMPYRIERMEGQLTDVQRDLAEIKARLMRKGE